MTLKKKFSPSFYGEKLPLSPEGIQRKPNLFAPLISSIESSIKPFRRLNILMTPHDDFPRRAKDPSFRFKKEERKIKNRVPSRRPLPPFILPFPTTPFPDVRKSLGSNEWGGRIATYDGFIDPFPSPLEFHHDSLTISVKRFSSKKIVMTSSSSHKNASSESGVG